MKSNKTALLDDEVLIIHLSGGEIPEVAYHGSLYYLTEDLEGPRMALTPADRAVLEKAVVARYRDIIRRDLDPENRTLGLYRGLERARVNWRRMRLFCERLGQDPEELRVETARRLIRFLGRESRDVREHGRASCINCRAGELGEWAAELGVVAQLPEGWQELCLA